MTTSTQNVRRDCSAFGGWRYNIASTCNSAITHCALRLIKWRAVRAGGRNDTFYSEKKDVKNNRSNLVLKPIIRTFNKENHLWPQFIKFLAWSRSYYHITKLRNSTLQFIFNLFYHSNQNWHFDVMAWIEWTSIFRSICHWRKWYFWRYNFLLVIQPRPENF